MQTNGPLHSEFASDYSAQDIEHVFDKQFNRFNFNTGDIDGLCNLFLATNNVTFANRRQYQSFITIQRRKFNLRVYSKVEMIRVYTLLRLQNKIQLNESFFSFLKLKSSRGWSGVNVVTIFTSGHQMGKNSSDSTILKGGCPMDCFYCPYEVDDKGNATQPRSYLSTEPGNMRATENKHHPFGQTLDRLHQLELMGHISPNPGSFSKCEFIISGGTFNFYPKDYIYWFVTCMYYACNMYYSWQDYSTTPMGTLLEEQLKNETASIRIIGLTIETRPDYVAPLLKNQTKLVNLDEIEYFRELGVTRVQVGIQHTDDTILKKVNRQCTAAQNKEGIRILKQNGIKTDIHIMFDLPGASPEKDLKCIDTIVDDPDYQADQWKLYPTETTKFTKIKEWRDAGTYNPYAEDCSEGVAYKLVPVIAHALIRIHAYIRTNRVVRDIPHQSIEGGLKCGNLRQVIDKYMTDNKMESKCIRHREVKMKHFDSNDVHMFSRKYLSSGGIEYFISYESKDLKTLYGFVRLRLNRHWWDVLPYLHQHALVRELHVYGSHSAIGSKSKTKTQHQGLGSKLLAAAEEVAFRNGFKQISVISGIGVREYYRKKGYALYHTYMTKTLSRYMFSSIIERDIMIIAGILCLCFSIYCIA
jgi:elongator complex protein 3